MSSNFKKCPNGHYYDSSLSSCPYCPSIASDVGPSMTERYQGSFVDDGKTKPYFEGSDNTDMLSGGAKTMVEGQFDVLPETSVSLSGSSNKTQFFDSEEQQSGETNRRDYRRLVGWLVSYTIDEAGMDFKLYEGRNIIGRDGDCQIVIPDNGVTGKHAILLYRNGKYSITDQQSSNGTYVNDEDIELDPKYIKDGDVIKIGNTVLKFRTSF